MLCVGDDDISIVRILRLQKTVEPLDAKRIFRLYDTFLFVFHKWLNRVAFPEIVTRDSISFIDFNWLHQSVLSRDPNRNPNRVRQFHSRISLVFFFLFSIFIFFYFHGHFHIFRFFFLFFRQFNSRFYAFLMCQCSYSCLSNPFRPLHPCNPTPKCMLRFYWFLQLLVYGPTAWRVGQHTLTHCELNPWQLPT